MFVITPLENGGGVIPNVGNFLSRASLTNPMSRLTERGWYNDEVFLAFDDEVVTLL